MQLVYLVPLLVQVDLEDLDAQVVQGIRLLKGPLVPLVHVLLLVQQDLLDLADPESRAAL